MPRIGRWLALAWLIALPGLTALRAPVWRSNLTLWTDAAAQSTNPRAWVNLGSSLIADGQVPAAHIALARAMRLADNPARPEFQRNTVNGLIDLNLSVIALGNGDVQTAKRYAKTVIQRWPEWRMARTFCTSIACD